MRSTDRLSHALLAGIFLYGGFDAVKDPESKVKSADKVVPKMLAPLAIDVETRSVVRCNGFVQMGAAAMMAMGILPRIAAGALIGSIIPTTIAGHRFWEETNDDAIATQRLQFLKNLAMLGGLVAVLAHRTTPHHQHPHLHINHAST